MGIQNNKVLEMKRPERYLLYGRYAGCVLYGIQNLAMTNLTRNTDNGVYLEDVEAGKLHVKNISVFPSLTSFEKKSLLKRHLSCRGPLKLGHLNIVLTVQSSAFCRSWETL